MLIIVMLNNTIEYYEVKFNERYDSIISTLRSFSANLSGAINQGIVICLIILRKKYKIDEDMYEKLLEEIQSRRGQNIENRS